MQNRIIGKTLTLPKHEGIILNFMPQTWEKWTPWFWVDLAFEWYGGAMVFRVLIFIFLFRNCGKMTTWRTMIYIAVAVIISKAPFWKLVDIIEVLSQQLRGTLTMVFEWHLTVDDFADMDQHMC